MLKGFEDTTAPLTKDEQAMVPVFVQCMEVNHRGTHKAISAAEICKSFNMMTGEQKWDTPRLRKLISYIVVNDLLSCLVANSKGYYIATDYVEVIAYQKSLEGRLSALRARIAAIRRQAAKFFGPKQMTLF